MARFLRHLSLFFAVILGISLCVAAQKEQKEGSKPSSSSGDNKTSVKPKPKEDTDKTKEDTDKPKEDTDKPKEDTDKTKENTTKEDTVNSDKGSGSGSGSSSSAGKGNQTEKGSQTSGKSTPGRETEKGNVSSVNKSDDKTPKGEKTTNATKGMERASGNKTLKSTTPKPTKAARQTSTTAEPTAKAEPGVMVELGFTIKNVDFKKLTDDDKKDMVIVIQKSLADAHEAVSPENIRVRLSAGSVKVEVTITMSRPPEKSDEEIASHWKKLTGDTGDDMIKKLSGIEGVKAATDGKDLTFDDDLKVSAASVSEDGTNDAQDSMGKDDDKKMMATSPDAPEAFTLGAQCGEAYKECAGAAQCFDHVSGACTEDGKLVGDCAEVMVCAPCFPNSRCGGVPEADAPHAFTPGAQCTEAHKECAGAAGCFNHVPSACGEDGKLVGDCAGALACAPCFPNSRCGGAPAADAPEAFTPGGQCTEAYKDCATAGLCFSHGSGACAQNGKLVGDCAQVLVCAPCFPNSRCGGEQPEPEGMVWEKDSSEEGEKMGLDERDSSEEGSGLFNGEVPVNTPCLESSHFQPQRIWEEKCSGVGGLPIKRYCAERGCFDDPYEGCQCRDMSSCAAMGGEWTTSRCSELLEWMPIFGLTKDSTVDKDTCTLNGKWDPNGYAGGASFKSFTNHMAERCCMSYPSTICGAFTGRIFRMYHDEHCTTPASHDGHIYLAPTAADPKCWKWKGMDVYFKLGCVAGDESDSVEILIWEGGQGCLGAPMPLPPSEGLGLYPWLEAKTFIDGHCVKQRGACEMDGSCMYGRLDQAVPASAYPWCGPATTTTTNPIVTSWAQGHLGPGAMFLLVAAVSMCCS